ncbi:MAG: NADH-quinone oxidoreductase subunit M [Deltaproteobacteria bacterium]
MDHLLTWMVVTPALGALVVVVLPASAKDGLWRTAVVVSLLPLALALGAWSVFDPLDGGFQLVERSVWVERFGMSYFVGVDGISLLLVLLTTFLSPLVLMASADSIGQRMKAYLVAMLLLETTMLGTLVALDVLLFYVFWELMLVPMFLIIGVWGGPRRVYAAVKFIVFTLVGSLPMLVALVYLGLAYGRESGQMSFALTDLYNLQLDGPAAAWCFAALLLAFAIKVPMWPVHTWLPDAHVEAPTGGSVILAGVLLKMGTYGVLRFAWPLFPQVAQAAAPAVAVLALIGIIYGALVAMVQPDLKKLVAYSSVSHMGFVMLGLASLNHTAISGGVYQMLSHGLCTGALFLLVGVLYERRHTRLISEFGGLWKRLPIFAACFLVVTLASIGLPGLSGFVGEFLILLGAFRVNPWMAACAVVGIVLGAAYMLRMFQQVMFGPIDKDDNRVLADMSRRELAVLAPILALIVLMGVYPKPFLETMEASVDTLVSRMERPLPTAVVQLGGNRP